MHGDIFKRELQIQNELLFKPIIHEDEEFTPRLFFVAGNTLVTKSVYFRRRMRTGSIMHTKKNESNVIGYLESIRTLESLIGKHKSRASRYLQTRIVSHLISIQMIKDNNSLVFSKNTEDEFVRLTGKYKSIFLILVRENILLYKICRFVIRRLGYKMLL